MPFVNSLLDKAAFSAFRLLLPSKGGYPPPSSIPEAGGATKHLILFVNNAWSFND
jgi:hypothetical protein